MPGFQTGLGRSDCAGLKGASGNVAMVELGTRLAIERARTVTLHLKPARWSSIPTVSGFELGQIVAAITISGSYGATLFLNLVRRARFRCS